MLKISLYTALFICLSACGSLKEGKRMPQKMAAPEYLSWYGSAAYPFRDTVEQDGITYICALVPREVEIARQLESGLMSKEDAASIQQEAYEMLQFQLQIMVPQAGTDVLHYKLKQREDVSSRTSYFSFGIKKDLRIKYKGTDTLDCSSLHFEKGISNLPVSRIMAYFPYEKAPVESVTFDAQVFSGSIVSFDFKELAITHLPQLKL